MLQLSKIMNINLFQLLIVVDLTAVKLSFQKFFLITEEKFRYATQHTTKHLFGKDKHQ